ncbi:MAG: hypothetical protein R6U22_03150 [Desulfohalobiaceae bacterium]
MDIQDAKRLHIQRQTLARQSRHETGLRELAPDLPISFPEVNQGRAAVARALLYCRRS